MRELLICLLIFAACVAGFYFFYPDQPEENTNPVDRTEKTPATVPPKAVENNDEPVFEPNIARRNVTPESVLPAPEIEAETLQRLPAVLPPPPPPKPPEPVRQTRPVVLAAGVLKSGDTKIILSDIDPLPLEKKCRGQNGTEWPCGMFARTEMRQFIRRRPIECDPVNSGGAATIVTRCKLDNFDISAWLVLTGWATPKGDLFSGELEEAKSKERGQWRKTAP